jgi:hypothetical protein
LSTPVNPITARFYAIRESASHSPHTAPIIGLPEQLVFPNNATNVSEATSSDQPMSRKRGRAWKSMRRRIGHQLRGRFAGELHPDQWVFIIGCYNSGTTLLTNLLGAHPSLHALPREGVELTDALPRPEELGWPRMWSQCEQHVCIEPGNGAWRARRIKKQWAGYAPRANIVVEKSITNVARLGFLAKHFAPAYFIYLIRDGYAVAEGIQRRAKPKDWGNSELARYPMEMCAAQWALSDTYFRRDHHVLPQLLEIRYELLADDPTGTLDQVANFLGIPAFPNDIATRTWDIHRVQSGIRNMNANAIKRLSGDDLDSIERVAGKTLGTYGYHRPAADRR